MARGHAGRVWNRAVATTQHPNQKAHENMSDSDVDYDSKAQFIEAVRNEGAVLDGVEYFTEGKGSSTSYHARNDDGEVEDINKSDVEDAWDESRGDSGGANGVEEEQPEEVHLGTFYFSQSNWTDQDRESLENLLDQAGWYIDGEVDSGGYRIKAER